MEKSALFQSIADLFQIINCLFYINLVHFQFMCAVVSLHFKQLQP